MRTAHRIVLPALVCAALTGWACGGEQAEESDQAQETPAPATVAEANAPQRPSDGGGGAGPPRRVLRLIYARYTHASKPPEILVDDRATLQRFFDDGLVDLLLADFACQKRGGGVCKLDWDPFVGAQDWKIEHVSMARLESGPDEALLEVKFDNLGKPMVIDYSLVKLDRGWRIHDITYPSAKPGQPSLRTTLSAQ